MFAWAGQALGTPKIATIPELYSVAWSPNGQSLATGNSDVFYVYSWNGQTLTQIAASSPVGQVLSVAWSPDGQNLAVGALSTLWSLDLFLEWANINPSDNTFNSYCQCQFCCLESQWSECGSRNRC